MGALRLTNNLWISFVRNSAVPIPFVRPDGLPDRLAVWLREEILEGRLEPGARLVESELALRCGVSRVPLREAIRILAQEGLLDLALHRGAVVRPLSTHELHELFGVRTAIEAFAASAAARHPKCAEALADIVTKMQQAVATGEVSPYRTLAADFHEALVDASGNRLLVAMYAQIRTRLSRYQAAMVRLPRLPETSIAEHGAIVAAIAAGDPVAASTLAIAHLDGLVAQLLMPATQREPAKNRLEGTRST